MTASGLGHKLTQHSNPTDREWAIRQKVENTKYHRAIITKVAEKEHGESLLFSESANNSHAIKTPQEDPRREPKSN